jgi:TolB-like protein
VIYRFDDFELDTALIELRERGEATAIEPQVFALLCFLIENRERVVTKEEIIRQIWNGRIVSDSALSSRIKSARRALHDDGHAQTMIRTVHGVGFRFMRDVVADSDRILVADADAPADDSRAEAVDAARPSIAVLPFRRAGPDDPRSGIADALPQDLITELSRLRWLFVIARASAFRFRGEDVDLDQVKAQLNVRYCLSGSVEFAGGTMIVSAELCDLEDRGIVWSERFQTGPGAVHEIREEIVRAITGTLELRIPLNEARRARLKQPDQLDAWAAYHVGLQHMYRFTRRDNEAATGWFERAVAMDPGFARAHAGLSFTHFQDAFLNYNGDTTRAAHLAKHHAALCLERDPVEPFGNLTMGRTFLLRGDLEGSMPWLERANALNPNYAQAKYSRGWTEALMGNSACSLLEADAAVALSPLDPLYYGMLSVRAFAHIVTGESAKAADWAEQAAASPGAHCLIAMIAVAAHGLNDNDAKAQAWAASARARTPDLNSAAFLRAFPFRDPAVRKTVTQTLARYGF